MGPAAPVQSSGLVLNISGKRYVSVESKWLPASLASGRFDHSDTREYFKFTSYRISGGESELFTGSAT